MPVHQDYLSSAQWLDHIRIAMDAGRRRSAMLAVVVTAYRVEPADPVGAAREVLDALGLSTAAGGPHVRTVSAVPAPDLLPPSRPSP